MEEEEGEEGVDEEDVVEGVEEEEVEGGAALEPVASVVKYCPMLSAKNEAVPLTSVKKVG